MFIDRKRWRSAAALALAVAITTAGLAGCSATSGSEDGKTLKVWWFEAKGNALDTAWKKAIDIFEAKHPDVKVEFQLKTFDQIQKSGQLILQSNSGPDVLEYNKGNATAGQVAKAGLLTDLTKVAADRKWDLDNSAQDVGKYDAKGSMGSGKRYGVTNYGEFVGVWYNKTLFDKYNLTPPKTMADFENALKTFSGNGITPLSLGANDYFGVHLLYELALQSMDSKSLAAYQRFTGPVDWKAWTTAATTYQEWVKKGYIAKDSTGISAQDSGNAFIAGKFPMMISGSWWAGTLADQVKDGTIGQFLLPGTSFAPGSGGNIWVVPAKAKNKTLAEDFIEITQGAQVQSLLGENGGLPVNADPSTITSPVGKLELDLFSRVLGANDGGLALYPDFPVPGLYDVLVAQSSDLVQGNVTPAEATDKIKAAYDQGKPQ